MSLKPEVFQGEALKWILAVAFTLWVLFAAIEELAPHAEKVWQIFTN